MLCGLPSHGDDRLLVGPQTADDAAVYRLSEELALIQTVDFFPPMVDDPYTFGQIAAANALSDVYAMGGEPRLALNLLCFPSDTLPPEAVREILRGGADKVAEAGAAIAGGHTIEDREPKYGLCVTGFVHPDRLLTNANARPGDTLILTKPLGSGILTTAAKAEMVSQAEYEALIGVMTALNASACRAMAAAGAAVHACTDITGFGLMGHAREMAVASGVTLCLQGAAVPVMEGALALAQQGFVPGGAYRNRAYMETCARMDPGLPAALSDVLFDPQTSGGLLIAVAPDAAPALLAALRAHSPWPQIVGRVTQKAAVEVDLSC